MSDGSEADLPPLAGEVTQLLEAARRGEPRATERLFSLVYGDLREIARRQLGKGGRSPEARGPSATSVVHEACMRLVRRGDLPFNDRAHFFAVATKAMRQIIVDRARTRQAAKRGGDPFHDELEDWHLTAAGAGVPPEELLALDAALEELEQQAPRQARVVEWHFFGGLTFVEIGEALECSERTVKRDWRAARAMLHARLLPGS
jgi:RNA polymerase sigma factor (TIGR02999 family)